MCNVNLNVTCLTKFMKYDISRAHYKQYNNFNNLIIN